MSGMTQVNLLEMCCHNMLSPFLAQMGVVECYTWKQLKHHGEQAEEIVARV